MLCCNLEKFAFSKLTCSEIERTRLESISSTATGCLRPILSNIERFASFWISSLCLTFPHLLIIDPLHLHLHLEQICRNCSSLGRQVTLTFRCPTLVESSAVSIGKLAREGKGTEGRTGGQTDTAAIGGGGGDDGRHEGATF